MRDAWRASLLTGHKLILQEYVTTSAGQPLLAALAKRLRKPPGDVIAAMATLPRLDFFVPFREHRLSWRGSDDFLVVATARTSGVAKLPGFTSGGEPADLALDGTTPTRPIILVAPSKPSSRRVAPQPSTPGDVIQAPTDGEESGVVTYFRNPGDSVVVQLADLVGPQRADGSVSSLSSDTCIDTCDGSGGSGGSGGTGGNPPPGYNLPLDTIYVRAFQIRWVNEFEIGGHEVEFWATLYGDGGSSVFAKYRRDGVEACSRFGDCIAWQSKEPGVPLFIKPAGPFGQIDVDIYELQWYGPDYHGSTQYDYSEWSFISSNGLWHVLCNYTCPPEDADMLLKSTRNSGF